MFNTQKTFQRQIVKVDWRISLNLNCYRKMFLTWVSIIDKFFGFIPESETRLALCRRCDKFSSSAKNSPIRGTISPDIKDVVRIFIRGGHSMIFWFARTFCKKFY